MDAPPDGKTPRRRGWRAGLCAARCVRFTRRDFLHSGGWPMLAMLSRTTLLTSAAWTVTPDVDGRRHEARIRCQASRVSHSLQLWYEPVVVVYSSANFVGALAGRITSIDQTLDIESAFDLLMYTEAGAHPFRAPFIPANVPLDPDWYRIQADYWEDHNDQFADPCRRFGEVLATMGTDSKPRFLDESAIFTPRPERSLPDAP